MPCGREARSATSRAWKDEEGGDQSRGEGRRMPALGEGRRAAVRQNKKGGGEALAVARRFPGPFSRFWAERRRSERRENPGVHDERKRQGASAASAGCADATRPLAGARGGEEVLRGLVEA